MDFYHHGWLVPNYTNAHTPLPNIVLGTLWHVFGLHILTTRLIVCAFAAAGLLAVFRLTQRLLSDSVAAAVTLLTAFYPIWYTQSTLAHADIFVAAFTLWAFATYLPASIPHRDRHPERSGTQWSEVEGSASRLLRPQLLLALLFSLAVLSKETSLVQPATLAALELCLLLRDRRNPELRRDHLRWIAALACPVLPLIAWFAWHHHVTGFTFGNPEYLRYNATANLTLHHVLTSLHYRFLHLFWQRNIWLPVVLALACLLLPRRLGMKENAVNLSAARTGAPDGRSVPVAVESAESKDPGGLGSATTERQLSATTLITIAILIAANWLFFSILGGALLTRYLLPVYPLILVVCVATWRGRTRLWPVFAAVTAAAFVSAWWLNPPTSFAPEDNLTYRDMIVVHQEAIDYVAARYPDATVLTAWPVSADLFNPDLGYVTQPIKAWGIEDFTRPQILRAAQEPGHYDTAIVFTTHFTAPAFRNWLLKHPDSYQGREFAATRDLTPAEIAALLGGRVVWKDEHNGEWAAVLRFDRSYDAQLAIPARSRISLLGGIDTWK